MELWGNVICFFLSEVRRHGSGPTGHSALSRLPVVVPAQQSLRLEHPRSHRPLPDVPGASPLSLGLGGCRFGNVYFFFAGLRHGPLGFSMPRRQKLIVLVFHCSSPPWMFQLVEGTAPRGPTPSRFAINPPVMAFCILH